MRITYFALRDLRVGDEVRQAGDLVPEAQMWPYLSGYIQDGKIAPVLVATLPEEQQVMLLEWEEEVYGVTRQDIPVSEDVEPDDEDDDTDEDTTEDTQSEAKIDKRTKAYRESLKTQEKVN